MRRLKKYCSVLGVIIRCSFYQILTYRANFLSGLLTDSCFNLSRVVFVNILFLNAEYLGDWSLEHYFIFFGCSFLMESIYMFFFYNSHTLISRQIHNGNMDFLLTKPMSEMFMLSVMNVNIGSGLSNFILGMIFLFRGARGIGLKITTGRAALLVLFILCGSVIYFSISLIINLLSFWVVKVDTVFDLFLSVTDLYRYPGDIFPRLISAAITFVIPLQFISIIPAKSLLGIAGAGAAFLAILYSVFFALLSYGLMRMAAAAYTSAGG